MRQQLGSVMMLHDRGELRTDVRPPRLTVTYHAPCQQQAHGVRKRLIDAQAAASIEALPHALRDDGKRTRRFAGRRPAIFLDYDGTLTPIVDRLEDAVISQSMGQAVRGLAELKVTPGKMVYEIQPRLEWDKGRAVLYLLEALGLDAFRVLSGRGIGIFVGRADDPEVGDRGTSAAFVLDSIDEVERFLDRLAR